MNVTITRKLIVVAVLIAGILAAVIWNSITADVRLRHTQYWVAHTYMVLLALEHVEDSVVTTESEARRYYISGTPESYAAYYFARGQVADGIDDVRRLCADNVRQTHNCETLDRIVTDRLARLQEGVNLRRSSGVSFLLAAGRMNGPGDRSMVELRSVLAEMKDQERTVLEARQHANDEGIRRSAVNAACLVLLIGLMMASICGLIAHDIATHREADAVARQLRIALAKSGEGIARFDRSDLLVTANEAYARAAGYTPDEMVGMQRRLLVDPSHRDAATEAVARMRRDGESSAELLCIRKDGSHYYKHSTLVAVTDDFGGEYYAFSRDITERKLHEVELQQQRTLLVKANEQLADMAARDALTGVKNRRAFQDVLGSEVESASRSGAPLSLIMVDVDHFKLFNDAFGHQAGDEALRLIACVIEQCSREGDCLARYGGEEFALVLPYANASVAAAVAERLRAAVEQTPSAHRELTISVGVASLMPKMDAETLIRDADAALYSAKIAGRNRVAHSSIIQRTSSV